MSASRAKIQPVPDLNPSVLEVPQLTKAQLERVIKIIYAKTGIFLKDDKSNLVITRLAKRLRALNIAAWDDYLDFAEKDNAEMQEFVNALTTNKTEFFRERSHFDFISDTYLSELYGLGIRSPVFWIGASSYGQEAYTLAMVAEDYNARHADKQVDLRVLSTDIDTSALAFAQAGIYEDRLVERDVPQNLREKFFLKGTGKNSGLYRVGNELRRRVKFRTHNLCDILHPIPITFDLIMIRNVLIYFDQETVDAVINKALCQLRPGGILIVGLCETIIHNRWGLEVVGHSIYRKVS